MRRRRSCGRAGTSPPTDDAVHNQRRARGIEMQRKIISGNGGSVRRRVTRVSTLMAHNTFLRYADHMKPLALWMIVPFCATLALAGTVLAVAGLTDDGIRLALFVTARLQFLLFWTAYCGGALASLFGPAFMPLRRHGRELGLAFASALTVHLGLVAALCAIGDIPAPETFVIFGAAVLCAYALVLFSVASLQRMLGTGGWTLLRFVAMNYILYAFADDFLLHPIVGGVEYLRLYSPFALLTVAAPLLRLAAFAETGSAGRFLYPTTKGEKIVVAYLRGLIAAGLIVLGGTGGAVIVMNLHSASPRLMTAGVACALIGILGGGVAISRR